jgi:rhomboid family GlyGly-CTERM serine protease
MSRERSWILAAGRYASAPLLAGAALLVLIFGQSWTERLEYDRTAVAAGQFWRILTCHWTHWSVNHFTWDALVFLALGFAAQHRSPFRFLLAVIVAAIAIPLAVFAMLPSLHNYRGLSGIDCALFGLLVTSLLNDNRRSLSASVAWLFLIAFFLKTAFELWTGTTVFVDGHAGVEFAPVPLAHLVGGIVGAIVALMGRPGRGSASLPFWRRCRRGLHLPRAFFSRPSAH